ncbi:neuropeptide FF receptor 1 isoform X1 [Camponotus floridanus]|nr:neuropeptide FF receptor 1 isoform X1 [Camponotus floridanus]XP_025268155.1 neuropeptide FF receptor 1 isoform X1 [Camponotus floridanus]
MRVNAIGITSTTTTSTSEATATSRIEVATNSVPSSSIPYNGTVMEMDLMTDILWDFYEKFNGETNYLLIILYVPVMALAITANILLIAVVFKYHYMRSVTNYFVVNLSVADLLVTIICMPVAVSQAVSIVWSHGELMCKLSSYLQGVAVAASVFTIMAMSIDRYLAIRSPMAFRRVFNRKSTVLVIVALWLVALSIFAPVLRGTTLHNPSMELLNITFHGSWAIRGNSRDISQLPPVFYICSEDFRPLGIRAHVFGAACFVLVYAIPGFVVILAYSMMGRTLCSRKPPFDCDSVEGSASSQQSFRLVRERRRIAWILLLLAVLFALCWLPYNVLRLLVDFGVVEEGRSITDALTYCLFLGHANSALNPVIYCFMTRNFRRSVSEILRRTSHGLARRKPRRKSAMIDDGCGGCSVPAVNGGARRGLLHQRRMLPGCGCGIPVRGNRNAVLALRRTATSSSGYDTFYSRHSPHLHCYMLRSIRDVPRAQANPPENSDARRDQQQEYDKNNGLETSQPRPSTLCTTDERRPCP